MPCIMETSWIMLCSHLSQSTVKQTEALHEIHERHDVWCVRFPPNSEIVL